MNPINRVGHLLEKPEIKGFFTEYEQGQIMAYYTRDPSDVPCPLCGPGKIEVIAFTEKEPTFDGSHRNKSPEGEYVFFVYCHECTRSIGIIHKEISDVSKPDS